MTPDMDVLDSLFDLEEMDPVFSDGNSGWSLVDSGNDLGSVALESDDLWDLDDLDDTLDFDDLGNLEDIWDLEDLSTELVTLDSSSLPIVVEKSETLEFMVKQISDLQVLQRQKAQSSSDPIMEKLLNYYQENNPGLPSYTWEKDGHVLHLDEYIAIFIRLQQDVSIISNEISDILGQVDISFNSARKFQYSGAIEEQTLHFLNRFKDYYISELANFDSSLKPSSFFNLDGLNASNIVYPNKIDLQTRTFVCGHCGETVVNNNPFFISFLSPQRSGERFYQIVSLPVECSFCNIFNVISQNHFTLLQSSLNKLLSLSEVMEISSRLQSLSHDNDLIRYSFPVSAVLDNLPAELSSLFVTTSVIRSEEFEGDENLPSFDLVAAKQSYSEQITTHFFDSVLHSGDTLLHNLTRILCSALGLDYRTLKIIALNTLLFHVESLPYSSSFHTLNRHRVLYLLGDSTLKEFEEAQSQINAFIDHCLTDRDFFVLLPLLRSNELDPLFFDYIQSPKWQDFFEYCSDNMILRSLYGDIINMGKVKKVIKDISKNQDSLSISYDTGYIGLFNSARKRDIHGVVCALNKLNSPGEFSELENAVESFSDKITSSNRNNFYYGDIFTQEDLDSVDLSWVDFPLHPPRNGLSVEEYFNQFQFDNTLKAGDSQIFMGEWFDANLDIFFEINRRYLFQNLKNLKSWQFSQFISSISGSTLLEVLEIFGITGNFPKVLLQSSSDFLYPTVNDSEILAKYLICEYPYKNLDISERISQYPDRSLAALEQLSFHLLKECKDEIVEELSASASDEILEIIRSAFPSDFG